MNNATLIITVNFVFLIIAYVLFYLSIAMEGVKNMEVKKSRYEINARVNYDGAPDFSDDIERDICEGYVYAESESAAIEQGINSLIGNIRANGYDAETDGENVAVYDEDGELVETYYDFSATLIK